MRCAEVQATTLTDTVDFSLTIDLTNLSKRHPMCQTRQRLLRNYHHTLVAHRRPGQSCQNANHRGVQAVCHLSKMKQEREKK